MRRVVAGGLTIAGSSLAHGVPAAPDPPLPPLPAVRLGDKQISRLIAGANPIGGVAYSTKNLSQHMREYFTVERTTDYILHCERSGITAFDSHYSPKIRDALRAAREKGSKMQWICVISEKNDCLEEVLDLKPIAICHHGGVADLMFASGKQEQAHDFVKKVHDHGVLAGVSTHNPEHLAAMEEAGWESDLYMTCFYNLARSKEEIIGMCGQNVVGTLFLEDDPKRMTEQIRQVEKPCLAFKILAAGRLCWNERWLESAFSFAYEKIKPNDAAIVGMYTALSDEVREDSELARKFGQLTT